MSDLAEIMAQMSAAMNARAAVINDNLPSWSVIDGKLTELDEAIPNLANLAEAKVVLAKMMDIIRRMARVEYWLAKGTQE